MVSLHKHIVHIFIYLDGLSHKEKNYRIKASVYRHNQQHTLATRKIQ